ncbi:MAG: HDOD domain-containing protein [Gemmatimonadales bacterium]
MPRRPEDLIKGAVEVGTVQGMYERLVQVIDHPLSSASDVGRVISEDPGLTARLLRLVNSPIYGFPSRIDTVSQAISIVGMTQLRDLAIGTSFMRLFQNVPSHLVDMESFWRHSIACGLTARALAAHRREANVERFFVSSHDIGRPIIFTRAPLEAASALLEASRTAGSAPRRGAEAPRLPPRRGRRGPARALAAPSLLVAAAAWHHSPGSPAVSPSRPPWSRGRRVRQRAQPGLQRQAPGPGLRCRRLGGHRVLGRCRRPDAQAGRDAVRARGPRDPPAPVA